MARKKNKKQPMPQGPPEKCVSGDGLDAPAPGETGEDAWEPVMRHLGRILREEGFEAYLGRKQPSGSGSGIDC